MQSTNNNSIFYVPGPIPSTEDLPRYLGNELRAIQAAIMALSVGHLDKSYTAPAKPRDGDIRYCDGTSWNAGSGAGVYYFNGSIWKFLG